MQVIMKSMEFKPLDTNIDTKIFYLLKELGISYDVIGAQYITEGIKYVLEHNSYDVVNYFKDELKIIADTLFSNANKLLDENMHRVKTIDEAKEKKGIVEIPWCENKDCAMEIENILEGNTLGEPIDDAKCSHSCPICGGAAKTWMRYAKTY